MKKITTILVYSLCAITWLACEKDFLEKKPATNIRVPNTLNELQLLLNNTGDLYRSPVLGELSADDYFMSNTEWKNQNRPYYANSYVWQKEIFAGDGNINDWRQPYAQVLCSNVILDQLKEIRRNKANAVQYDKIKGTAYFMRAWSFFDLAQVFAMPYDEASADKEQGIPLKLSPDMNQRTERANLAQTYAQIMEDAHLAKSLLQQLRANPIGFMPSKQAAYAFLARVYLTMRKYDKATLYADSALQLNDKLIDYNTASTSAIIPFSMINNEIIYQSYLVQANPTSSVMNTLGYSIDTVLYHSYHDNDLRKLLYFQLNGKNINKKRGYSGSTLSSNGLAIDEMYLIRAEGYARLGELDQAHYDLNELLRNRYKTGTYVALFGLTKDEVLDKILLERRKELVWRGLRWNDLRRLNLEGRAITLNRSLAGTVYILPPNDRRYALPIPPDVVALAGIPQNQR